MVLSSLSGAIGVFDSGVGGLTVLQRLQESFPDHDFVYLGDTARVPYGTKSAGTVITYAKNLTAILLERNVIMIVIACNTASAHALADVQAMAGDIPVIGMVEPAVRNAIEETQNRHIGVIATQSTIRTGCYEKAIHAHDADIRVTSHPAQLLVALAEEGWTTGDIAKAVIHEYLADIFDQDAAPDTLILGCTHFPVLRELIQEEVGHTVRLIDCGQAATRYMRDRFGANQAGGDGQTEFLVTDDPQRFSLLAERFLQRPVSNSRVTQIDLQAFRQL